jgi:predicted negative regulator of RcsB-dependent stress response
MLARQAVDQGDLDAARQALQKAVDMAEQAPLGALSRVRLAQVQLAQQMPEAALDTLQEFDDASSFRPLVEELKGDALRALGRLDEARQAYQAGLRAAEAAELDARLIELKLNDLGGDAS